MARTRISGSEWPERIRHAGLSARARRRLGRLFGLEELELMLLALEPPALSLCPVCARGFVTPSRWEPLDGGRWRIGLRCNACGHSQDAVAEDGIAQRFAEAVTASATEIEQSLHAPEPRCMDRWRAAFSEALARDLIGPNDFARDDGCNG
jgi:hypothetical protein